MKFEELKVGNDGLIPVVTQDYLTKAVLMVAYMNKEAYEKTLETGRVHYYSRSRQSLWLKGETSGHFQYVKEIHADCDQDTLLVKVKQIGVACHTGRYSCFFNLIQSKTTDEKKQDWNIIQSVYNIIKDRKTQPKEGSYTNYLFDKGIDKILKKVGEENAEVIIAAKNPDKGELIYETSDLLYHLMVLMVEKGISWDDVLDELQQRR